MVFRLLASLLLVSLVFACNGSATRETPASSGASSNSSGGSNPDGGRSNAPDGGNDSVGSDSGGGGAIGGGGSRAGAGGSGEGGAGKRPSEDGGGGSQGTPRLIESFPGAPPFTLVGGTVVGLGPRIVQVASSGSVQLFDADGVPSAGGPEIDISGHFVMPGYVDAHVHLEYYDVRAELPAAGILAAVDLAAPVGSLQSDADPLLVELSAGPMITAVGGYPTQSWGQNGFGREVGTVEEAEAAALELLAAGAALLKVPFAGEPALTDEQVLAITAVAHAASKKVAAHALDDAGAARARSLGCDILAHTPTAALSDETIAAWSDGAVISTLVAFGAGAGSVENLARLRAAGTTILYGTDLGNLRTRSLSQAELDALVSAGLSGQDLLDTFTKTPAEYFALDVGRWQPGGPAHFVVLAGDPLVSTDFLIQPEVVVNKTRIIGPRAPE